MIGKALLTTLILLLGYSALIYFFGYTITRTAQTVGQRNLVKVEDYRYEADAQYRDLIVGSSMSERLISDSIGSHVHNLAMPGLSAQAGLGLIQEGEHQPEKVYVESNSLLTVASPDQLETGAVSPTWRLIKRYLPFMRQKYQPVGVFKALLRDWKYGKSQFIHQETGNQVDTAFRNKAINLMMKNQHPLPDSVFRQRLSSIWGRLMLLRKQGTQIVLFEVPVDPRIQHLSFSRSIRAALLDSCRVNDVLFIIPPDTDTYQTTDGIHLTNPEAARHTHYLSDQLRKRGAGDLPNRITIR